MIKHLGSFQTSNSNHYSVEFDGGIGHIVHKFFYFGRSWLRDISNGSRRAASQLATCPHLHSEGEGCVFNLLLVEFGLAKFSLMHQCVYRSCLSLFFVWLRFLYNFDTWYIMYLDQFLQCQDYIVLWLFI